jgi:hypothetical protein
MVKIKINHEGIVDWAELEDVVDLNNVVITGNRQFIPREDAPWWTEAKEYIRDMDCYGTDEEDFVWYDNNWNKLTDEQRKAIIKEYDECSSSENIYFIASIARIIHPELPLRERVIRGYCQSDWNDVIYEEDKVNIDLLEAVYFGNITELIIEDDEEDGYYDWIPDYELWEIERNGNLTEFFRKRYGYGDGEEIEIYESNGVIKTVAWKKVG